MNLLIVDDEYLIIEDLLSITDWEMTGVTEIYTAMNAARAKQLLLEKQVDLMLCDIEMPQTDGLELLKWAKENCPSLEVIMLTCHAQFDYARTALRYGSFDYLLKPVTEEDIDKIIRKAAVKLETDRARRKLQAGGELWNRFKSSWEEHFWEDCLRGLLGSEEEVRQAAEARNCEAEWSRTLIPILFHSYSDTVPAEEITCLKAAVAEILKRLHCEYRVPALSPHAMAALCFTDADGADTLKAAAADMFGNSGLADRMGIYMGKYCRAWETEEEVNRLRQTAMNNVCCIHGVFDGEELETKAAKVCLPEMSSWPALIDCGRTKELSERITIWLNLNKETGRLNRSALQMLQYDLEQVLYAGLQENGIHAHQFLYYRDNGYNRIGAIGSVRAMQAWVERILNDVAEALREVREPLTLVEKVKKYVKEHLEEDLNRIKIAEAMFLNPDYLDRRFKKDTGCSVNRYILKEQLEMAKKLLLYPDITVSEIAVRCGYANMSNFSAMFKRETGVSPVEYRKNSDGSSCPQ